MAGSSPAVRGERGSSIAPAEHIPFHPVLAIDKVRYIGEPIAVVAATDAYCPRDALDLIEVATAAFQRS